MVKFIPITQRHHMECRSCGRSYETTGVHTKYYEVMTTNDKADTAGTSINYCQHCIERYFGRFAVDTILDRITGGADNHGRY
jgi:hypothetical protein